MLALVIGCGGSPGTTTSSGGGGESGTTSSSATSSGSGGGAASSTASGAGSSTASGASGSGGMSPVDPRCHAVLFDGLHSIVAAPAISAHNPIASFTVEAWVYPVTLPTQYGIVAGHHGGASGKYSYNLAIDSGGHAVFAFSADGTALVEATTSAKIALNDWSHVAGTFDAASQKIYVFLAGGSTAATPAIATKVFSIDKVPFDVGRESPMTTPENPFIGYIDEVRLSSVARYTDVFEPKPTFASDASTIALYHFDESTGQTAADSSANANTAILQQNAKFGGPPGCP